ncbi:MAG TPA: hypothetical protein VD835_13925 [Pyrinomonadaceae bacterium]|nr:hypothetical protein [Pyrinomonadaceae bacterium]
MGLVGIALAALVVGTATAYDAQLVRGSAPPHWAFGVPMLVALACLGRHRAKQRKLNKVFAAAVLLIIAAHPLRIALLNSEEWLRFAA